MVKLFQASWWHERWPLIVRNPALADEWLKCSGIPALPPKGIWTGWRNWWPWQVFYVGNEFLPAAVFYTGDPSRKLVRQALLPIRTERVALRIGPDDVYFAFRADSGGMIVPTPYYKGQLPRSVILARFGETVTFK